MCGITGYFSTGRAVSETVLTAMADSIRHRGPDDAGVWLDQQAGIGLAFRRLSILDLSTAGHQPMASAGNRFVITFNGEIYNHLEMRRELDGAQPGLQWRGHSDTETLLAAFEAWGIEATLKKTVGMFAIAVWDQRERTLTLARDRMGEKPLYYGWHGKVFLFGSELKALRAHPDFRGDINRDAIALQMRHCAIPAPHSIYQGIFKLLPGTSLTLTLGGKAAATGKLPSPVAYWSLADAVRAGIAQPFKGSDADVIAELARVLEDSVRGQMLADVPLGALLSGGVDSSLVVALMQAQSSPPLRTFTIGFDDADYNEAHHAKAVAQHLGTRHTELYVTSAEAQAVIPLLPQLYDEPFSDSSQIPTFLVAQMTRRDVTVALSGDGGDELFGGYNRYFMTSALWRRLRWLPVAMRRSAATAIRWLSPAAWNRIFAWLAAVAPASAGMQRAGDKAHKLAAVIDAANPEEIYFRLVSEWNNPEQLVLGTTEPPTFLTDHANWGIASNTEETMMFLDAMTYLPDDILTKMDRATMGVSLEGRMPLLDHRVVELAWRLPLRMKIRNGQGKWALRQVLYQHVPQALIERPKMGFGVPLDAWLRGPLRDWAEALLNPARLKREAYIAPELVQQKWREHLSGERNWQYHLWDVLMFQAWLEHQQTPA